MNHLEGHVNVEFEIRVRHRIRNQESGIWNQETGRIIRNYRLEYRQLETGRLDIG